MCDVIGEMLDRIHIVVDALNDSVADLEDQILSAESYEMRHRIADLRRQAIALRRYIGPERDVLLRLENHKVTWIDELMGARACARRRIA